MRALKYLIFFLAVSLTACVSEPEGENVTVGSVAPDFTAEVYSDGIFSEAHTLSLSSLKGSPVVLVFFNTSCPDCREELEVIQRIYDRYADETGIICVARSEKKESVEAYWIDHGFTLPVAPQKDSRIYNLYAKSVIPRTYILNSEGVIAASFSDSPIADFDTLSRLIEALSQ